MKKVLLYTSILSLFVGIVLFCSCTDEYDRISSSQRNQPAFSTDTVKLDTLFSRISSSTRRLMVYNRNKQAIRLNEVRLQGGNSRGYRVNIDGRSGVRATDLVVLPGDSLHIFVEATFAKGADDAPTLMEDSLAFVCAGRTSYVLLRAFRQNVDEVDVLNVKTDQTISALRPLVVRDSIVIGAGATLRLEPGARLLMDSESSIIVHGRIMAQGNVGQRIRIESLRQDYLLSDLPYSLIPGQWKGFYFAKQSSGNTFEYTTVRNAVNGMLFAHVAGTTSLRAEFNGCILTNMKGYGLRASGGRFVFTNTEVSNTLATSLDLMACDASLTYCSIINFYPWSTRRGVAIAFRDYIPSEGSTNAESGELVPTSKLRLVACVVDGNRSLQTTKPGEQVGEIHLFHKQQPDSRLVSFVQCFLRTIPAIEATTEDCLFADPKALIELKEKRYYQSLGYKLKAPYSASFVFDLRPLPSAPFVGKASYQLPVMIDLWGIARPAQSTAGAYEPVAAAD